MKNKSRTNVYKKSVTKNPLTGDRYISYTKLSGLEVCFGAIIQMIVGLVGLFAIATKPTEAEVEAVRKKEGARQASNKAGYSGVEADKDAKIAELKNKK